MNNVQKFADISFVDNDKEIGCNDHQTDCSSNKAINRNVQLHDNNLHVQCQSSVTSEILTNITDNRKNQSIC